MTASPAAMVVASRPLRVVHVVNGLEVGGLEKQVIELVRRADRQIVRPEIVCTDYLGRLASLEPPAVPLLFLGAQRGLDWRAVLKLARHFRRSGADIVHSHNERSHFLATLAGRLVGVPVLINTRHGVHPPTTRRATSRRRIMARLSHAVVAVSSAVRDATVQSDGIPAAKVQIIANGTDVAAQHLTRGAARQRLGLDDTAFVIGAAGRLVPEKGYANLIEALARARTDVPQIAAALLGDGALAGELAATARASGCEAVRFYGYRSDAVSLLPAFDVFVQPSLTEGISLSVIEAMAAAVPVIATAVDGNSEAIGDEGAGLLIPPGDAGALAAAIVSLARDPEARARLATAARRRVEKFFSIDATARAYEALYLQKARAKRLDV